MSADQECLETVNTFTSEQLLNADVRQKTNYNVHFEAGELVWVYSPLTKKGCCPKLDSHCRVLESIEEVVYWFQLPTRGRKVALQRE